MEYVILGILWVICGLVALGLHNNYFYLNYYPIYSYSYADSEEEKINVVKKTKFIFWKQLILNLLFGPVSLLGVILFLFSVKDEKVYITQPPYQRVVFKWNLLYRKTPWTKEELEYMDFPTNWEAYLDVKDTLRLGFTPRTQRENSQESS